MWREIEANQCFSMLAGWPNNWWRSRISRRGGRWSVWCWWRCCASLRPSAEATSMLNSWVMGVSCSPTSGFSWRTWALANNTGLRLAMQEPSCLLLNNHWCSLFLSFLKHLTIFTFIFICWFCSVLLHLMAILYIVSSLGICFMWNFFTNNCWTWLANNMIRCFYNLIQVICMVY